MKINIKLATAALVVAVLTLGYFAPTFDYDEYTATVTKVETKRSSDSDRYLIYTKLEDGNTRVFTVTDSLMHWRWSSSDMYADLLPGTKYKFGTYGYRVPLLSWYENILTTEVLTAPQSTESSQDFENMSRKELIDRIKFLERTPDEN